MTLVPLPSPSPEELAVVAVVRRGGPPSILKLLLGLHRGLQTRGDEVARFRRQAAFRAQQLERVVHLSGHSSALSQITERAEMLRGRPFVALLKIAQSEVELGVRPLRVLAHRLAEKRHRLVVDALAVACDPQPHERVRSFRAFLEGRLELTCRLRVTAVAEWGLSQPHGGGAAADRDGERSQEQWVPPSNAQRVTHLHRPPSKRLYSSHSF